MNDDYMHINTELIYVVENIPGPPENNEEYTELLNNFNSQLTAHCQCNKKCIQDNCCCLQISGGINFAYTVITKVKYKLSNKNFQTFPLIECNNLCSCSDDCGNRLVQKGPIEGLVVKTCKEDKGMGLFTKNPIPRGAFICEYAGEVITKSQALKRQEANQLAGKMNYIYCLNEHSNQRTVQTFVDPSQCGNIGRYLNHSCEPNCHIIPVRVDIPIPKLAIFSNSDITPNMELTFDYGSCNVDNPVLRDHRKGQFVKDNGKKCLCNSHLCRGLMPFDVY